MHEPRPGLGKGSRVGGHDGDGLQLGIMLYNGSSCVGVCGRDGGGGSAGWLLG